MNKHFNIKKLAIFTFMFICFFAFKTEVKAEKYVCFYQDIFYFNGFSDKNYNNVVVDTTGNGNLEVLKRADIYVKLTYENNKASFTFYDKTGGKTYYGLCPGEHDSASCAYGNGADIYISSKSGQQLTADDFKNGCPTKIQRIIGWPGASEGYVYDIFKSGTTEYDNIYNKSMKDTVFNVDGTYSNTKDKCSGMKEVCNTDVKLVNIPGTVDPKTDDGSGKNSTTAKRKVCNYVEDSKLTNNLGMRADYVIYITEGEQFLTSGDGGAVNFDYNDVNGECPNKIYTSRDETQKAYYLTTDSLGEDNALQLDLIKYISLEKVQAGEAVTFCESLGSAMDYIRNAFTLIRYLVPALIIILSTIDFISVVISGENERMEKAKKKFIMRLVIGVAILLIPQILEFLLRLGGIIKNGESIIDVACLK